MASIINTDFLCRHFMNLLVYVMCVCLRACVRECVRECMRACVCVSRIFSCKL